MDNMDARMLGNMIKFSFLRGALIISTAIIVAVFLNAVLAWLILG